MDIVSKEVRSRMMAGIRGSNTSPEMKVRRLLHRHGFRYRLHQKDGEASVGDAVSKLHKLLPENEWGALVSAHRSLPIWMANAICAQSNCTCTHPVKLG
ncbi:hypothetical protein [Ectopseudomonas oleovorans]|uniref:hypothetical protein n=1 Tax=Ectopseudomonas oleovorans TaxID=301 RepID=UPI0036F34940